MGGGQRARLPNDLGLSQDPHRDITGIVRAGLGDGVGSRRGESGAGCTGRDEGESQRQQAQGDELPEEVRRREARLAKIEWAKEVVEQGPREKAAAKGKSAEEAKQDKPEH